MLLQRILSGLMILVAFGIIVGPAVEASVSTNPAWTVVGNPASAFLGRCVASAGDVNGDGYSDIIAGAPAYTNGASRRPGR